MASAMLASAELVDHEQPRISAVSWSDPAEAPLPHGEQDPVGYLPRIVRVLPSVPMSEGKNPETECAECGHPRSVHSEYTTPQRSGGSAVLACACERFVEPKR